MWEPRHPSLKVVLISVVSAAQVIIFFRKNDDHAEFAALGFSVSLWRQISSGFWGVVLERDPPTTKWCKAHTRLFGWFHFTGVLLLQGALRFASEQQNPENNF